ncbi:MAG: right-handed parallel beta-helix repeat-containing protein [Planctomycetales bacterium]|nr:right-handed parallel beta-helix repeat-containing protein [Planctomycetales bacterium]
MNPQRTQFLVTLLLWLAVLLATPAAAVEIWVAPAGDDAASGTREQPLASPAVALRRARDLRRLNDPAVAEGVSIVLNDGVYTLREPLRVRPEDSGAEASPTIIRAADGAAPVLSGGVAVTGWRLVDDNLPGLPAAARGRVFGAPLPRFQGRPVDIRQLWVEDRKAVRAREPDAGVMARTKAWNHASQTCLVAAGDFALPTAAAGVEMTVLQGWEIAQLRVRSMQADDDGVRIAFQQPESRLQFEHPWPPPTLDPRGAPYFLTGAVEFLDQPGEWFVDAPRGVVYYWPRPGEDLHHDAVIAPALETVVQIDGSLDRPVSHVEFRGVTFAHAAWRRPGTHGHVPLQATMAMTEAYTLRPKGTPQWRSLDNQAWLTRTPAAVSVAGAHHIQFHRCRFEHTAAAGLDFVAGTHDDRIEGCTFHDIGGNGLQLGSFQTGAEETHLPYLPADERAICTRERIANNVVAECGAEDWGGVGICVGYARHAAIEHNDVSDCPYTGISLGWGWTRDANAMRDNRVVANHVHRIATRMSDTAAIYTLSAQPGTIIRDNCIHDVVMSPYVHDAEHWFYLYLDEGSSWITVQNNWCPAARFLANANGPGNVWIDNGPQVDEAVKAAAGLEPQYRDLLGEK